MKRRRLPKYCQSFQDRHGRWRCYLRKKGIKLTALPGVPWSAEFMEAYAAALEGQELPDEPAPERQSHAAAIAQPANDNS
jgi:hypothetical protein